MEGQIEAAALPHGMKRHNEPVLLTEGGRGDGVGEAVVGVEGFLTRKDFVRRKDRRKDRLRKDRKRLAAVLLLDGVLSGVPIVLGVSGSAG